MSTKRGHLTLKHLPPQSELKILLAQHFHESREDSEDDERSSMYSQESVKGHPV